MDSRYAHVNLWVLHVEFFSLIGALHDESETGGWIFTHEIAHDAVGLQTIYHVDAQESPGFGVECRLPQGLGHHFPQTFEAGDVDFGVTLLVLRKHPIAVAFVGGPIRLFADVDPKQRRHSDEHLPSRIRSGRWR